MAAGSRRARVRARCCSDATERARRGQLRRVASAGSGPNASTRSIIASTRHAAPSRISAARLPPPLGWRRACAPPRPPPPVHTHHAGPALAAAQFTRPRISASTQLYRKRRPFRLKFISAGVPGRICKPPLQSKTKTSAIAPYGAGCGVIDGERDEPKEGVADLVAVGVLLRSADGEGGSGGRCRRDQGHARGVCNYSRCYSRLCAFCVSRCVRRTMACGTATPALTRRRQRRAARRGGRPASEVVAPR